MTNRMQGLTFNENHRISPSTDSLIQILSLSQTCSTCSSMNVDSRKLLEGHLYFRLDIVLIKGLSKHTLITYFPGMKIGTCFFLNDIFHHLFSKICSPPGSPSPKTHPFFQFCMYACTLPGPENNPNYIYLNRFIRSGIYR